MKVAVLPRHLYHQLMGHSLLFLGAALAMTSHPIKAEISRANTFNPTQQMLRVFLDVSRHEDYIKEEITYVDFVRDRERAQLHILMTSRGAGGDATEHTITFTGLEEYSGIHDTLKCITRAADTEHYIR